MRNNKWIILTFLVLLLSWYAWGQEETAQLTLEKIYKQGFLRTHSVHELRWTDDGTGYTTLEENKSIEGEDIVWNSIKTGEQKVLISASDLVPKGSDRPLEIYNYIWSGDQQKLLIFTNTKRVWRYHTRGDYWVYELGSKKLFQLGKGLESSSLMFAKFSPDGNRVAFVSLQNIYVENLADEKMTQLTQDGGGNIINGTFDWVYEEELDDRDGFRWSPDGKNIAYWQSNTDSVGRFKIIDNVDSLYPTVRTILYPYTGTANSAVKVGVVPSNGGETRWFDIPGDPRNNYLARMDFIPGSSELLIQQLNRRQNTDRVWIANAEDMSVKNIFTDKDDAFLDVNDNTHWLDNEREFTWISERDGWKHLYLISRDGQDIKLITPGNYDVIDVDNIDAKGGYVYFIATMDNYTQRYLYRCSLKKPGPPERITPDDMRGHSSYDISPDAKWAVQTFSNHMTPDRYELVSLPHNKPVRLLEDNHTVKAEFDDLHLNTKEFFKVDIGGTVLDAWMIKPPDFDSTKKYPVIFYVYGEPAASTVEDAWEGGDLWHEYLSQLGYIVMSVDNRGTAVPRGREWRKCIYEKMGVIESQDQAAAVKAIEKMYPFVDPGRIGIWGWSGGGGSTLNAMFRYPDLYSTGIAVAFISNLRLYDTIYEERYEGIPGEDDEAYKEGSPVNYVKNLKGHLMLIHGTGDDNVHYQNCELLIDELVKDGKAFSMMSYPMRTHGIYERPGTSYHLRLTMKNYWLNNLPAGPR